jgi:predicted ATPase with chaperone activity
MGGLFMDEKIAMVQEKIQKESEIVAQLKAEIGKIIVGQEEMINKILIGLLTGGHILIEGVPGLAKSLTVSTLANVLDPSPMCSIRIFSEFSLLRTCFPPISSEHWFTIRRATSFRSRRGQYSLR